MSKYGTYRFPIIAKSDLLTMQAIAFLSHLLAHAAEEKPKKHAVEERHGLSEQTLPTTLGRGGSCKQLVGELIREQFANKPSLLCLGFFTKLAYFGGSFTKNNPYFSEKFAKSSLKVRSIRI